MERAGSERICYPAKERQTDTKWSLETPEDSWGSRGRRFKSCHSLSLCSKANDGGIKGNMTIEPLPCHTVTLLGCQADS